MVDVPKYFMIDFKVGLQKVIKLNIFNSLISECFFHFLKCILEKEKKNMTKLNIQKY